MTPGTILLEVRQKFKDGLRAAYHRDAVRPRILRTEPIRGSTDTKCEIHVLTSSADWLNLIWALKSFYWSAQRHYTLCIHDDGSLNSEYAARLREHFPEARIILKAQADASVLHGLAGYPRCLEFRKNNHLAPKIFDFAHFLQSDRMLLLDSDVLFFREPIELLRRIEDPNYLKNTANADVASAYVRQRVVRAGRVQRRDLHLA